MENKNSSRLSAHSKYLKPLVVVLLVALVCVYLVRRESVDVFAFMRSHEKLSILIGLVLYTLLGATFIPSEPLTVFLALLHGPLLAVLTATLGNTFAALLEYFIGGSIGDLTDFEKRKAGLPFRLGELPFDSPVFLLLGRMLPGFGPKFVGLAGGIYHVPLFSYTWTAALANLVGAVIVAFGGYGLANWL